MGHPERMGLRHGWSEATFLAASRTTTPKGEAYQNLCIGCDRFHEQVLGPCSPLRVRAAAPRGARRPSRGGRRPSRSCRPAIDHAFRPGRDPGWPGLRAHRPAVRGARTAAPSFAQSWDDVVARARGQTVNWNAWGRRREDQRLHRVGRRRGREALRVRVNHVKLKDTGEAVTRVVAEKSAGRDAGGSVDLIWINGPNFLAMKEQKLLHGPYAERLPNWRLVDTVRKRSNVIDFTIAHEGYESPWRMAQVVFIHDAKRVKDVPRSVPELLEWAKRHPGRLTHPNVRNFLAPRS